ncbi:hypothetical protein BJV77DRAFT_1074591 [Russula vinacea]|nr:hypothetical protein BJV77DRAFT_1074591 [Russula vinacea]
MEGIAYPSQSALVGGWTDPRKQDSLAYLHLQNAQISEEVNLTGLGSLPQPGPTQEIDGRQTPSSKRLLAPDLLAGVKLVNADTSAVLAAKYMHNRRACCEFKWTRPYEYRAHLEKQHPNVNPDEVLDKPAGSRLRSTIIGRDRIRFSPAVEPDQLSQVELQRPITLAPEYAEPSIAIRKHEDGRRLYFLGAADTPSALSSTEMCFHDMVISIQNSQIGLILPSVHLGGSTGTDSPSGSATPLMPALTPPIGHCRPVFGDPMVEPSSISSYPFPVADYSTCEIRTNIFAP